MKNNKLMVQKLARVKLVNITKYFGDVVAVDHVSFEVKDGEFFALLGPSGSGKTTTLRIIAGLEEPDEGELYIDDRLVNDVHPKDRDVAMVFQNYALYPHMTVYENIAFPLMIRRKELNLTKEDVRKRVLWVAKMLQIENLLERYPSQLSGGQQQRVALARALVRNPKVWLLDEPLSNLDAKLRLYMRAELKKLHEELKITTIYVTHDQVEAMSMADRIAVMNKGKVLQIGTPDELYTKPRDTFVATFIGVPPMNLIKCELKSTDNEIVLSCPGFKHALDPEIGKAVIESLRTDEVLLGVRPEHIKVDVKPLSNDAIKAKVLITEPLGAERILMIKIDDTTIRAKAPSELKINMGDTVYLHIKWNKILLFDPKTGKAIV